MPSVSIRLYSPKGQKCCFGLRCASIPVYPIPYTVIINKTYWAIEIYYWYLYRSIHSIYSVFLYTIIRLTAVYGLWPAIQSKCVTPEAIAGKHVKTRRWELLFITYRHSHKLRYALWKGVQPPSLVTFCTQWFALWLVYSLQWSEEPTLAIHITYEPA